MPKNPHFYPVILAGGSGTRFWPRSRRRMAKQVLNLDGEQSMIQQTVERLLPLADEEKFWVITNDQIFDVISGQLKKIPRKQIVSEPVARNTAPAIGLAAFLLLRQDPKAVIGMFPADHVIKDEKTFRKVIFDGAELAATSENMVVMGIAPHRAETGYGYIEAGEKLGDGLYRVRRFTEKPNQQRADEFMAAGNYYWNSGMFLWSAQTLVNAMREHLSETAPYLEEIAASWGTSRFQSVFEHLYEKCENISIDYAVLEPRSAKGEHSSNLYCLRADFGWNDLGSWAALFEHQLAQRHNGDASNVIDAEDQFVLNAEGNYVYSPKKFVAAVGVKNIVVVETEDALLVTTREHSQDVGKVVKHLAEKKITKLI
ncbi:MAG: mannose-1-phosphate guanylyltransferase [Acidobacteria bacterium]|nr:mannose-1-phosphate guanylyltransferase [Acidobacteriota bacterium]MBV9435226.1 mannose-1-phosphate guanylyltransferase [Acidobacteriota bacterium]